MRVHTRNNNYTKAWVQGTYTYIYNIYTTSNMVAQLHAHVCGHVYMAVRMHYCNTNVCTCV